MVYERRVPWGTIGEALEYHTNGPLSAERCPGVPLGPAYYIHRSGRSGRDEGRAPRGLSGAGVEAAPLRPDGAARVNALEGCMTCYAGDTLVLVYRCAWGRIAHLAEVAVARVVTTVRRLVLEEVPPENTETLRFYSNKRLRLIRNNFSIFSMLYVYLVLETAVCTCLK